MLKDKIQKLFESHQESFSSADGSIIVVVNYSGGTTSGYIELNKGKEDSQTIQFDDSRDQNYKYYMKYVTKQI